MATCARCGKRKGKRSCPALAAEICAACCGAGRGRDLRCPPGCRHLSEHAPYAERRAAERKPAPPAADDPLKDERLAWLALNAESPLLELAARLPGFSDADAVRALEDARETLRQARGVLILPGAAGRPGPGLGEPVLRNMDGCRFERGLILSGREAGYRTEDKLRVLDRVIEFARACASSEPGGRAYLDLLAEQFARLRGASRRAKLITPP